MSGFRSWAMADSNPKSSWLIERHEARSIFEQLEALREALVAMREVAAVANDGDPWYCEHEGIDVSAAFAKARAALGDSIPAMNPVSPATVGEGEPGRKATARGDVDTSVEQQRHSGSPTSFQDQERP